MDTKPNKIDRDWTITYLQKEKRNKNKNHIINFLCYINKIQILIEQIQQYNIVVQLMYNLNEGNHFL
jgi:hypothetical protein